MSVRLYHPHHGYHVLSYGDDEAVFVRHGWVREEDADKPQDAPQDQAASATDAPKRRGRKPKDAA